MNPHEFAHKWRAVVAGERAAYVSHFEDLYRLVGHATPYDPSDAATTPTIKWMVLVIGRIMTDSSTENPQLLY